MAHNFIQIIFTYNAIKYLSNLKLHKVSQQYAFIYFQVICTSYGGHMEVAGRSYDTTLG